jgi:hypothetical protein
VVKKIKKTLVPELFSENCAVNEKMWKNMIFPDRLQMSV